MAQFRVLVTRWPRVTKTNDAGKIVESVEHHLDDVIELPDDVAEWALPAGIVEPYVAEDAAEDPAERAEEAAAQIAATADALDKALGGPGLDTEQEPEPEPEPGPYDGLSADELKAACKDRDLAVRGSKPELIARLIEADEAAKQDGDQGDAGAGDTPAGDQSANE